MISWQTADGEPNQCSYMSVLWCTVCLASVRASKTVTHSILQPCGRLLQSKACMPAHNLHKLSMVLHLRRSAPCFDITTLASSHFV